MKNIITPLKLQGISYTTETMLLTVRLLRNYLEVNHWYPQRQGVVVFGDRMIFMVSLQNAFANKLSPLGFNHFQMFVVDLMHEFELGIWKNLFIHLLHILVVQDNRLLDELDRR